MKERKEKGLVAAARKPKRGFIQNFRHNGKGVFGLIAFALIILAVFLIPLFVKIDAESVYFVTDKAPSRDHILGLDMTFQDCFSRLIIGGQVSLLIGMGVSVVTLLVGIPLGLIAGFYQGRVGGFINRAAELFMSFPTMVLLLLLVGIFQRMNAITLVITMGILGWPGTSKMLYSTVISTMKSEYIEAARAMGKSDFQIMFFDVLPNSITPILVSLPFRISGSIMMETTLSFLGLGMATSWGRQIYLATTMNVMVNQLWMWVPATLCLVAIIIAVNCLGEGIRDSYDPKLAKR
ncbi:MAG: ABC transporter permease [Oscillospiraceae bacterium]|nr:ABC transporter permease [Oscillospiraceae bacterium]